MKDSNSQLASEFLPEELQGLVAAQGLELDCLVCTVTGDYKGRKGRVRKITNIKITMALTVNGGGSGAAHSHPDGERSTDQKNKYDELLQPEEQVQIMQSSGIMERILPDHDRAVCLLTKVDEPALHTDQGSRSTLMDGRAFKGSYIHQGELRVADMALYKEGNASASSSDGNTEGILPDSVYSYIYDAEGILPDSRAEE